jgi:arylsulfatase A-like enzyme
VWYQLNLSDLPNVILIILDTMRLSALSANESGSRTPWISRLIKDGMYYQNCIAPSTWTVPSHASVLTGQLASRHGVHESYTKKGEEIFPLMTAKQGDTITAFLRNTGYNTLGYSANAWISPHSGFDLDFNSFVFVDYLNPPTLKGQHDVPRYGMTSTDEFWQQLRRRKFQAILRLYSIRKKANQWKKMNGYPLAKGGGTISNLVSCSTFEQPFFLFINLYEMHEPYIETRFGLPLTNRNVLFGKASIKNHDMRSIQRAYYEDEALTVDSYVGQIINHLKKMGVYDESLIIVTSDHGQLLGEKGLFGHGIFVHDELTRVPLVVKYPNNRKMASKPGYQSLSMVPDLVKDCMLDKPHDDSLTSRSAVSETFGIGDSIDAVMDVPDFERIRNLYDRPLKAVYYGGYKMTVDGREGVVVRLEQGGKEIKPEENKMTVEMMISELAKIGDNEFVLPESA